MPSKSYPHAEGVRRARLEARTAAMQPISLQPCRPGSIDALHCRGREDMNGETIRKLAALRSMRRGLRRHHERSRLKLQLQTGMPTRRCILLGVGAVGIARLCMRAGATETQ